MIWTFLVYLTGTEALSAPVPPKPLFIFSQEQREAVITLKNSLDSVVQNWGSSDEEMETISTNIRKLLHILYFPEKTAYSNPISNQPNLQFICYNMIQDNGDYEPIHVIPPPLAAHQYVMRLKGLHYLHNAVLSGTYNTTVYPDWIRQVFIFLQTALSYSLL